MEDFMKGMFIRALSITLLIPTASVFAVGNTVVEAAKPVVAQAAPEVAKQVAEVAVQAAPVVAKQAGEVAKVAAKSTWYGDAYNWVATQVTTAKNKIVENPYISAGAAVGTVAAAGLGYGIYRYAKSNSTEAQAAAGVKSPEVRKADVITLDAIVAHAKEIVKNRKAESITAKFKLEASDALSAVKGLKKNSAYKGTYMENHEDFRNSMNKLNVAQFVYFVRVMGHVDWFTRLVKDNATEQELNLCINGDKTEKNRGMVGCFNDIKALLAKQPTEAVTAEPQSPKSTAATPAAGVTATAKTDAETSWYTPTWKKGLAVTAAAATAGLGYYFRDSIIGLFSKVAPKAVEKATESSATKAVVAVLAETTPSTVVETVKSAAATVTK